MCTNFGRLLYPAPVAVRRQARTGISEAAPFNQRAYEWLGSREAELWAKKLLKQYRLPIDPKELTSDAMERVYNRFHSNPELLETEEWKSGVASHYCITVMRNLVNDLMRGRKRSGRALLDRDGKHFDSPIEDDYEIDGVVADGTGTTSDLGGGKVADRLRVALELSGAKTWLVSAALSNLTLAFFLDAHTGTAPLPLAGAKPADARLWPCLWFAGQRDLFDGDGNNSQSALRKKRNRRMKEVVSLMKSAGARIGIEDRS
jgi:DNA-directed RNA polymerase specialized sigma24 family protein